MSGSARSTENNNIARDMIKAHVASQLTGRYFTWRQWCDAGKPYDCLVEGYPFRGIYGWSQGKADMVLVHPDGTRARIMTKWQGTSGSVDEKFPYVLEQAFTVPEDDVVILAGGTGAKDAAVEWLVNEAENRSKRTMGRREVVVMRSVDEVAAWLRSMRTDWATARAANPPVDDGRLL